MNDRSDQQQTYKQATEQALQSMQPKIGTGQLAAMGRMGLDELSHALKAFPDSIPITPETGALGEPTPQEVFAEGQGKSPLELYQRDLYSPDTSPEKEVER